MSERKQTEVNDFQDALDDQQASEEVEVWTGAYSVRMFLPALVLALPITAVLFAVAKRSGADSNNNTLRYSLEGILLLGWIILLGIACFRVLGTEYMLTNKRFYYRRGFRQPGPPPIELADCLDVKVHQSRVERWLRAGRVSLSLAKGKKARCVLAGLPDPERVAGIIRKHVREVNTSD
jgi:hypothetical protein